MIKLVSENVLLKPSHRRQLMSWLRRSVRLGQRLGGLVITITLSRIGNCCQAVARVHDSAGDFACRMRRRTVRDTLRDLSHALEMRLHQQRLQTLTTA